MKKFGSVLPAATLVATATLFTSGAFIEAKAQSAPGAGPVTEFKVPAKDMEAASPEDITVAKPMPLPRVDAPPKGLLEGGLSEEKLGTPRAVPGKKGSGQQTPLQIPVGEQPGSEDVEPQEFGTANHPYTTARVDVSGNATSNKFPFSASGQLYFKDGASTFVCSATLIKKGVIVTAAHCVAPFGGNRFYTGFQFYPARFQNSAPFGVWTGSNAWVMTSWLNGTDTCSTRGVVCRNDVAVIRLAPQAGAFPGTRTGWLGYGINGFGFTPNNLALFTQLGYPVSHDSGTIMQRTDSQAFVSSLAGNSVWGSRQTGGSSGGPEVANPAWSAASARRWAAKPRPTSSSG